MSSNIDVEIYLFLESGVPHFHQNRRENSLFSAILTWPMSFKTDVDIDLLCNPDMPNSHPNRFGNSVLLKSGHSPIPPQQMCKFTFSWHHVCPIFIQTDFEIHRFPQSCLSKFHRNRRGHSSMTRVSLMCTWLALHLAIPISSSSSSNGPNT